MSRPSAVAGGAPPVRAVRPAGQGGDLVGMLQTLYHRRMAGGEATALSTGAFRGISARRGLIAALMVAATVLLVLFGWAKWRGTGGPAYAAPIPVYGVVVVEGGPAPPPRSSDGARPDMHAHVVVTGTMASGARLVRHFAADARGRFALKLPPGVYRLAAFAYGDAPLASQPHQDVTVEAGQPVHVRITVQAH
jgi:hypothetical protein